MGGRLTIDNRINKYITSLSKFIKFHLKDKTFSRYNSFQNYSDNLYTIIFVSIRLSKSRGKKIKFRDSNVRDTYDISCPSCNDSSRNVDQSGLNIGKNIWMHTQCAVNSGISEKTRYSSRNFSHLFERERFKNIHFDAIWSKKIDLKGNLILTEGRRERNYAREISKFEEGIYLYA